MFIGCTPFYGLHLPLCVVVARLFRLNQVWTYLAAHVSLPGLWPLLVLAEIEVGRWLRGAEPLALRFSELRGLDLGRFAVDLLLGSAVVGTALAVVLAAATYGIALRLRRHPEVEALVDETSRMYLDSGMFTWEFVRGKLRHDPLYFGLLRRGVLPPEGLFLDLGCGRGILLALVVAARRRAAVGSLPPGWPPPPGNLALHGIEVREKAAAAARAALAGQEEVAAEIETGDLRALPFPRCRAALLLDVLHYLPAADQERLLDRAAAALEPGGLLLVREADASGGFRFQATRAGERLRALGRGRFRQRFHYRTLAEWRRLLEARGLAVEAVPMSQGTPYANVLLEARRPG